MDAIHNEILQVEPNLMAELLFEVWKLVGRSQEYRDKWSLGLLTPIYKKGYESVRTNYRPVCMLHARKIIKGAIGTQY